MAIDHTNCSHPRTPAGRRACRANRAGTPELIVRGELAPETVTITPAPVRRKRAADLEAKLNRMADDDYIGEHIRKVAANGRMRARMDREYAARIQPRRGGARVPARTAGCVQAALHIDAHGGKCACGWKAQVAA